MELHQFDLLLIAEGVERAWFQVREGAVCRGEDSEALVGVVELRVDLIRHFGVL